MSSDLYDAFLAVCTLLAIGITIYKHVYRRTSTPFTTGAEHDETNQWTSVYKGVSVLMSNEQNKIMFIVRRNVRTRCMQASIPGMKSKVAAAHTQDAALDAALIETGMKLTRKDLHEVFLDYPYICYGTRPLQGFIQQVHSGSDGVKVYSYIYHVEGEAEWCILSDNVFIEICPSDAALLEANATKLTSHIQPF